MNTVQIKVSTDNITYSPNWIEVPYGSIPLIDSNGVGSGSATYSSSGNQRIICKYIKYKITLRDDEVTIP
jgi:hypothetical protein